MSGIFERLFRRRQEGVLPVPLFSDDEVAACERLHVEWEEDYKRRARRLLDLERRANYLTSRLFAPVESDDKGQNRGD
jgi:hypothetical protein